MLNPMKFSALKIMFQMKIVWVIKNLYTFLNDFIKFAE